MKGQKKSKLVKYGHEHFVNFEKQKETNLVKYGVENIFERSDLMKNWYIEKCGVNHPSKNKKIQNKIKHTKQEMFIDSLFDGNRLGETVYPLFERKDYSGVKVKYKFKCKSCLTEFSNDINDGKIPKCPKCFPNTKSKCEFEMIDFIRKNLPNVEIIQGTRKVLPNGKELDIYIPSKNLAIELNGTIWHSERFGGKNKFCHLNKTIECEKLGITLLHIFDSEWINKIDIVKSKILNKLHIVNTNKIFARNCKISNVTLDDKSTILNNHHIQGNDSSSIQYGLYHNDELVSVMTFGKSRNVNEYELHRYCSSKCVMGGAGKLLKHFIKMNNPTKITTYLDRRHSNKNSMYNKIGF